MSNISKPLNVPKPVKSVYRDHLQALKVGQAVDIRGSYAAAVNAAARYLGKGNWTSKKMGDGRTRIWRVK